MSQTRIFNFLYFIVNRCHWKHWACTLILITTSPFTFAHGTVTSPPSRIWNCYQENPESPDSPPCIAAVASHGTQALYDWNEINQGNANGDHMQFVPNGNLASGGRPDKYGGMDQVRFDWVSTPVSPGPFTVTWTNSAVHATDYYDVYITNEDWTPNQPLTWENLTLLVRTAPSPAENTVDISVVLPIRTGKHVIYSIWQRSDSPEAFYSTSDIDFGIGTTSIELDENRFVDFILEPSPNPFNLTSKIEYKLSKGEIVNLKIYDIYGREVSTLVNSFQASGEYEVVFNGENLSSGVYLYVFEVGDFRKTDRMVLQK
ncbi:MAG: lytic polysaccharide monooxygenase [Chitinophagales bacterium]